MIRSSLYERDAAPGARDRWSRLDPAIRDELRYMGRAFLRYSPLWSTQTWDWEGTKYTFSFRDDNVVVVHDENGALLAVLDDVAEEDVVAVDNLDTPDDAIAMLDGPGVDSHNRVDYLLGAVALKPADYFWPVFQCVGRLRRYVARTGGATPLFAASRQCPPIYGCERRRVLR